MSNELFELIVKYAVKYARSNHDDNLAYEMKFLYKQFDKQIGKTLAAGEYVQYNGKLYRVLQTHTVNELWKPDQYDVMFKLIDNEYLGTVRNPIPAERNMEYFKGKIYQYDGLLYECIKDSEVPLYHLPYQLLDDFFVLYTY
jgi:hypothetical protein